MSPSLRNLSGRLTDSRQRAKAIGASLGGLAGVISLCGLLLSVYRTIIPQSVAELFQKELDVRAELFKAYQPAGAWYETHQEPAFEGPFSHAEGNYLWLSALNLSTQEPAVISNEIPFRLLEHSPSASPVAVVASFFDIGSYRHFVVKLAPQEEDARARFNLEPGMEALAEMGAPELPLKPGGDPDFFSLDPGEREIFAVEVRFAAPGTYRFQAGIEYFIGGKKQIAWIEEEFIAHVPAAIESWSYLFASEQETGMELVERCLFPFKAEDCLVLCEFLLVEGCLETLSP